jgi:Fe-S cluster assembly protein SufD
VGQIDENALFYLRSRGIDLDTARNLMIHAFVGEVIHRIGVLPIRKGLDTQTFIRLPGRHEAGEVPS